VSGVSLKSTAARLDVIRNTKKIKITISLSFITGKRDVVISATKIASDVPAI
jgi:hypothetical protein